MISLSIVTVHLDDVPGLARTHQSLERVLESPGLEWIVVDGGTQPENGEQAQVFSQAEHAATRFVSEPDEGIYDAMNKGSDMASGNYVLFLNAGDLLHPDFDLERILRVCEEKCPGMVWGDSWDRNRKGKSYQRRTRKAFWLRYGMIASHQAILFRRDLLGPEPYDTTYRIAADYDLICRQYRGGSTIEYLRIPICIFDLVGESSRNMAEAAMEESRVRMVHFGMPPLLDKMLASCKLVLWRFNTAFPGFRAVWRRWI